MKFNLLTKYLFVYAAVALLGFLGVTFISYRIDYAKVYNYYTDALYSRHCRFQVNTPMTISVKNTCVSLKPN